MNSIVQIIGARAAGSCSLRGGGIFFLSVLRAFLHVPKAYRNTEAKAANFRTLFARFRASAGLKHMRDRNGCSTASVLFRRKRNSNIELDQKNRSGIYIGEASDFLVCNLNPRRNLSVLVPRFINPGCNLYQ